MTNKQRLPSILSEGRLGPSIGTLKECYLFGAGVGASICVANCLVVSDWQLNTSRLRGRCLGLFVFLLPIGPLHCGCWWDKPWAHGHSAFLETNNQHLSSGEMLFGFVRVSVAHWSSALRLLVG
jgi:hypothetical protein